MILPTIIASSAASPHSAQTPSTIWTLPGMNFLYAQEREQGRVIPLL